MTVGVLMAAYPQISRSFGQRLVRIVAMLLLFYAGLELTMHGLAIVEGSLRESILVSAPLYTAWLYDLASLLSVAGDLLMGVGAIALWNRKSWARSCILIAITISLFAMAATLATYILYYRGMHFRPGRLNIAASNWELWRNYLSLAISGCRQAMLPLLIGWIMFQREIGEALSDPQNRAFQVIPIAQPTGGDNQA